MPGGLESYENVKGHRFWLGQKIAPSSLQVPNTSKARLRCRSVSTSALKMLDNIQRRALIIALRALPSTPSVYLEHEVGIEPLTLLGEAQQMKYWARFSSKPCYPVNAIVGKVFFAKSKYKNPALPFGATTAMLVEEHLPGVSGVAVSGSRFEAPWLLVPPKVDISLSLKFTKSDPPSHILALTEDHVKSSYAEHLKIYTDASREMREDELNLFGSSNKCFYTTEINLLAELSFVTLTIHLCNGLNDKNLVKPRKTCFLTV